VRTEPAVWTAAQAVAFLGHVADDRLGGLFEVLIGTGLRRGELLALRWEDIDITARTLHIDPERGTLSSVAGQLVFTAPKTSGRSAGVGLSPRVVRALERQAEVQAVERAQWGSAYKDDRLVFARENGTVGGVPETLMCRIRGPRLRRDSRQSAARPAAGPRPRPPATSSTRRGIAALAASGAEPSSETS
jgi:integrase